MKHSFYEHYNQKNGYKPTVLGGKLLSIVKTKNYKLNLKDMQLIFSKGYIIKIDS